MAQLIDIAFSVFNNHYLEEKTEQSQCKNKRNEHKAKLIALDVSSAIGNVQLPQDNPGKPQKCQGQKVWTCFKCKRPGQWVRDCTRPSLGPYSKCKGTNPDPWHWKVDFPYSQSGKQSSHEAMAALEDWGCLGKRLAPAYKNISIFTVESHVTPEVAGKKINFFVDTGPLTLSSVLTLDLSPLSQLTSWGLKENLELLFIHALSPVNLNAKFLNILS